MSTNTKWDGGGGSHKKYILPRMDNIFISKATLQTYKWNGQEKMGCGKTNLDRNNAWHVRDID